MGAGDYRIPGWLHRIILGIILQIEDHPTPNRNGSSGIKGAWGSYALFLCPYAIFSGKSQILKDFCALRTPIAWHILGAYFLQLWGVRVVRSVFNYIR